jgi:hypothetical protein
MICAPLDPPEELVEVWDARLADEAERYRNSPQGRRAAREDADRARIARAETAAAFVALPAVDAADIDAVMEWMIRYARSADHVDSGARFVAPAVLAWFAQHGYVINANVGDAFDGTDRDNVARYLIGQALDGIAVVGSPHPMFVDWAERFLAGEPLPGDRPAYTVGAESRDGLEGF